MADLLNKFNLPETNPEDIKERNRNIDNALRFNFAPETTTPQFKATTGELLYDPKIVSRQTGVPTLSYTLSNQQEEQYLPGLYQPTAQRVGNFFPTLFANLIGEAAHIATAVPDMVDLVATGTGLTNEPIFGWYDNIETFKNKVIDSNVPTYMTKEYAEEDLDFWQSLGHAEFYNKEVAPTLAFLISAYATGYGAAALKLGSRTVQLGVNVNKALSNADKLTDATRLARIKNKADFASQVAAQTMYESIAEGQHTRMALLDYYEPLINSGQIDSETANKRINSAVSRVVVANAALLGLTNGVSTAIINNIFKVAPGLQQVGNKGILRKLGVNPVNQIHDKAGKLVSSAITKKTAPYILNSLSKAGVGFAGESFEEGAQSVFSDTYQILGESDRISQLDFFAGDDLKAMALNLSGQLGTNEFNKAWILGGIIGGMAGGIGGARKYNRDVKQAESIRSLLSDRFNNAGAVLRQASIIDENGNLVLDEQGNPIANPQKIRALFESEIGKTSDYYIFNQLLDEGKQKEAVGLFMSRLMSPIIHQYVNMDKGKEYFKLNLQQALIEQGREEAVEGLPKEVEEQIDTYFDEYQKAYDEMSPEVGNYLRSKISLVGRQSKIRKLLNLKSKYRPGLKQDLTKEEKAEFENQKQNFIDNVSYAATVATARRNMLNKEIDKLNTSIQELENELSTTEEASAKKIVQTKIENKKSERAEKLDHRKQVENSLAEVFDPNFYNKEFDKYLDLDPNFEYLSPYERAIEETVGRIETEAREKGYNFGPADTEALLASPRSNDNKDRLNEEIYFRKNGKYYALIKTQEGFSIVVEIDKKGRVTKNATPVYLAVAEESGFFDDMSMLTKAEKDKIQSLFNLNVQIDALRESINSNFDNPVSAANKIREEIDALNKSIKSTQDKIRYRNTQLSTLVKSKAEEDKIKLEQLQQDIAEFTKQLNTLKLRKEELYDDLNAARDITRNYENILNSIELYIAKNTNITIDQVLQGRELTEVRQGVLDEFFALDEVQSVFKNNEVVPVDYASFENWKKYVQELNNTQVRLAEEIKNLQTALRKTKSGIVKNILYNLTGLSKEVNLDVRNIADFLSNNVPNSEALVELLRVYAANPMNVETAYDTNISKDPAYYDGIIEGLNLNNLSSSFFQQYVDLFTSQEVVSKIQDRLNNITASNQLKSELEVGLELIEEAYNNLINAQQKIQDVLPAVDFVNELENNLAGIFNNLNNFYQQLRTQGYIIDDNTQTNTNPDLDQSIENADNVMPAFLLRKANYITTINGITNIVGNEVVLDDNGMPTFREDEETFPESWAANNWINNQSGDTFSNEYTVRVVNATQLAEIFEGTNQKVPVTDETALYAVPFNKKGEVAKEDGYIVYFGIPQVETTFPGSVTTLDEMYVIKSIFNVSNDGIVQFNNKTYDLEEAEDYSTVLTEATRLLKEKYSAYRTELEQRTAAGEEINLVPEGLSKGVNVLSKTVNEETGEIESVFRSASTLEDVVDVKVAITPLEENPVTGIIEQTVPGMVQAYTKNGQSVVLNTEKLQDQQIDTALKLLGYLAAQESLNTTVTYMGNEVPVLPIGKQNGLIDLFMNWGRTQNPQNQILNKNILITGKGRGNRNLTYNNNGSIISVPLDQLVIYNADGTMTVNTENPDVQALITFLKTKPQNINYNATQNPMFENGFAMPTDITTSGQVSVGKKYKNYKAYILDNTQTRLVTKDSKYPQFLNRYIILPETLPARPAQQARPAAPTTSNTATSNPDAKQQAASQTTMAKNTVVNPSNVVVNNENIEGELSVLIVENLIYSTNFILNPQSRITFSNSVLIKEGVVSDPDPASIATLDTTFKQGIEFTIINEGMEDAINFEKLAEVLGAGTAFIINEDRVSQTAPPANPTPPSTTQKDDDGSTCGTKSGTKSKKTKSKSAKKRKSAE